jgi:hypothetical protein
MQPTAADYIAKAKDVAKQVDTFWGGIVLVVLVLTVVAWCNARDWRDRFR